MYWKAASGTCNTWLDTENTSFITLSQTSLIISVPLCQMRKIGCQQVTRTAEWNILSSIFSFEKAETNKRHSQICRLR